MLIGIADTFGKAYLQSIALFLIYLAMTVVLLIRPQGLFGIKYSDVSVAPGGHRHGCSGHDEDARRRDYCVAAYCWAAVLDDRLSARAGVGDIHLRDFRHEPRSPARLHRSDVARTCRILRLGAYAVAVLGAQFGVNAWIGVAAGVLSPARGAALIGFFCVRTGGIPFLMLTLALSQLVFSVALKWRDVTGGSDGIAIAEKPGFFGYDLSHSLVMYFMALGFFALAYWALRRLLNSPLGHVFVGIRENEQRMLAIGYPTRAYKLLAFTIAGAFAGLAGGLYAIFNGFISADAVYWTASGDVLIMTMLGGAGTLIGPAVGAAVFLLMKNVVSSYSEHWLAIVGVIFICCVMFFPGGIWGTLENCGGGGYGHECAQAGSSQQIVRQPGGD